MQKPNKTFKHIKSNKIWFKHTRLQSKVVTIKLEIQNQNVHQSTSKQTFWLNGPIKDYKNYAGHEIGPSLRVFRKLWKYLNTYNASQNSPHRVGRWGQLQMLTNFPILGVSCAQIFVQYPRMISDIFLIIRDKASSQIHGVSGGIVNILGGGSMDYSKWVHINMCPIFNGCGDTAVWSWRPQTLLF